MATYVVAFRFHEDLTYHDRRRSFIEEAQRFGLTWADSPSFFAIQTDETIDDLTTRLNTRTSIQKDRDMFFAIDTETKSARIWGKVHDQSIFAIIPYLTTA
jgi:hypothetical protein